MKKFFVLSMCVLLSAISLKAGAATSQSRRQQSAGSSVLCDDVARNILAKNAGFKIEDDSKASDFKLKATMNLGDAGTSKVVSVYTDPSDDSTYMIELYGEGCAFKALIEL